MIRSVGIKEVFWSAGTNTGNNGFFYWMGDSEPMTWTNWRSGEPNGDGNCIDISSGEGWKWNDLDCYQKRFFMCEKDT